MNRHVDHSEEAPLVERLLAGDEEGFTRLVGAHHASMVRLALTFVTDRGAAEEVVQETWLGVLKGLPAFEGRASLKTWIYRILVNRARTRGTRDGRTVNFSALEDGDEVETTLADRFTAQGRWIQPPAMWAEQDPEAVLLRRETAGALQRAIADLPATQRAVLTLRDVEGVDTREVCNILAISETNLRVLLHRARLRIRAALDGHLKRARDSAGRHGVRDDDGVLISLRLSQGDLGKLVGLARETVNGILQAWRDQGIVVADRRSIRVRDPERLTRTGALRR